MCPIKNWDLLQKNMELLFEDIKSKRNNGEILRIQTDRELNQIEKKN